VRGILRLRSGFSAVDAEKCTRSSEAFPARVQPGPAPERLTYDRSVAVTTKPKLDARKLRADFPIFEQLIHGKPLAYLDSAVTSQKPRQVIDKLSTFYETSYGNVHRGVYTLSERATAEFEGAREKVAQFINAPSSREVIFTRSATEAINLVAYAWGLDNLGPGDVVVVTELEHHSNFVPWQYIAERRGAMFRAIPIDEAGELQLDGIDEFAREGSVKVVANNLVSNALGTINPADRLAAWAHEQGAIFVIDAAQAAPHLPIDVQALDCDFLAISAHKMCGPSGVGALWGKSELLEAMSPFNLGGQMIRKVEIEKTTWNELPNKFEAGTPAIAEAVGFGAAIDYLNEVGLEAIEAYEHELAAYAMERMEEIPGLKIFGPPPERRAGIISFDLEGVHPHDVAQILDWEGVAVRAGHHCTQPLMRRLGVSATSRASFYLYTIPEEIDRLIEGLHKVRSVFAG
jgi:cysteine desulfurase / selenocysteine lyase